MRASRRRRGITMVEALTASGLLTVVMLGVVSLGINSGNAFSYGSARLASDNRGSIALQSLCQDLRSGSRASVDTSGSVLTITSASANSEGDYDRTASATQTTRYYVSGTTLYKQQGTSTPVRMAADIKAVGFRVDGSRVKITLTSRQQSGTKIGEASFNTEITLRNPPVE